MTIHETAILLSEVILGEGVQLGPYVVIGSGEAEDCEVTKIGCRVELGAHVVVGACTEIQDDVWCGPGCHVGKNCLIGKGAELMYRAQIFDRVNVGENSWIGGFLCNDSIVADEAVVFGKLIHNFTNAACGVAEPSPRVERRAFVGMDSIIIGGVVVGEGAYIAAGALLTTDARPHRLYMGIPARDVGPAPSAFLKWENRGEK